MSAAGSLADWEDIIDSAGIAGPIETLLPAGVRPRQLRVRTLLIGMLATLADHRPAHLTRVLDTLTALPAPDRARLGVDAEWRNGPHELTYRQAERTFRLVRTALDKDVPDGLPSGDLAGLCDVLLEASIPAEYKDASRSLAVDWTDLETFSRPPPRGTTDRADPEASWGHRRGGGAGQHSELFFGYYPQAATMIGDENGPAVPELIRRITVTSCRHDPVPQLVPVLTRLPAAGIPLGDILADSGYAHRVPGNWAIPLRAAGAQLIQDLHPDDRGPQGTYRGAIISSGNLYCPATPLPLLELGPLPPGAAAADIAAHDQKTAELARHKLGRISADDADGYHRVMCPAAMGKIRCPPRPASMTLPRDRPEVLTPPPGPPACCQQATITVSPGTHAKTAQKHDYPSREHRRSYARRSSAERTFSTIKDPASNDISRGWCRLMGLTAITLFTAAVTVIRNLRILTAWNNRQEDNARRAAAGKPLRTRRRRRKTLTSLAAAPHPPGPPATGHGRSRPPNPAAPACSQHPHQRPGQAITARKHTRQRRSAPPAVSTQSETASATKLSDPNVKIKRGQT